jgi:ADP-ribose pyrophosphatase
MVSKIKTLKSRLVYSDPENKWIRLYFDDVEFPDGSRGRFNKIIDGEGHPAVAIVPFSELGIGLVRQFRYAIGRDVWEIPRGLGHTEDTELEARRELVEETGLIPKDLIPLGLMHADTSMIVTSMALFAARCDPINATPSSDPRESCDFKWWPTHDAFRAAERAEIVDGYSLSALLRARLKGLV